MGRHVFSCRSLLLSTTILNDIYKALLPVLKHETQLKAKIVI